MILLVNLVRIIPSIKFISTVDAILGAIVTSHTPKSIEMSQPKYGQIINCYLTILIVSPFSLCCLRITTQHRSGTVDKMASIFTIWIWQPYSQTKHFFHCRL